jgi:DegV family protein with EDD domain
MKKKHRQNIIKIAYVDGIRLRNAILSSLVLIEKYQGYLNKINVFPIPDRDTGTNLLLTLKQTVIEVQSFREKSIDTVASLLSRAALSNAQGYSGTFLANFFSGFSDNVKGKSRLSTREFASTIKKANDTAYRSVSAPVEGTILTVIREWNQSINKLATNTEDFAELWSAGLPAARESLRRTRSKLDVLKKAGVVDAGAQGFVYFLEGIDRFIRQGNLKRLIASEIREKPLTIVKEVNSNFSPAISKQGKIGIVTDSSCDLPAQFLKMNRIHFIPLKIIFGQETYLDKIQMTPSQFYKKLVRSRKHPKTSQPSFADVKNIFEQLVPAYDHIISIHLPRVVSGTLDVIEKAAQKYGGKITCIDGKNISAALGLVVMEAVRTIKDGSQLDGIIRHIHDSIKNIRIYIVLPTVKYLVKGGRISKPKGIIGRILHLNPIISFDSDGRIFLVAKAFGNRNALKKSLQMAVKETRRFKTFRFMVAHADAMPRAKWIVSKLSILFKIKKNEIQIVEAAPVLGVHAGPGTVGFGFIGYHPDVQPLLTEKFHSES